MTPDTSFGLQVCHFFFLHNFYVLTNKFYFIQVLFKFNNDGDDWIGQQQQKGAQTHHLDSFLLLLSFFSFNMNRSRSGKNVLDLGQSRNRCRNFPSSTLQNEILSENLCTYLVLSLVILNYFTLFYLFLLCLTHFHLILLIFTIFLLIFTCFYSFSLVFTWSYNFLLLIYLPGP